MKFSDTVFHASRNHQGEVVVVEGLSLILKVRLWSLVVIDLPMTGKGLLAVIKSRSVVELRSLAVLATF